jgi:hypothetical protein
MFCSHCGKLLNNQANFCTHCGVKLEKQIVSSTKHAKRKMSLEFIDSDGQVQKRSSSADFDSLPQRHIDNLLTIPGLDKDEKLQIWLGSARDAYDGGWYKRALKYIEMSLERQPELDAYLFYYKKICEHVISIPLNKDEKLYEIKRQKIVNRIGYLPLWARRLIARLKQEDLMFIRCKWCGKYTKFVSPNDNSFGFISGGNNSCSSCGMSYPAPSWMWDSPDGRAYSYYRQSFPTDKGGKKFYNEFLKDYDPNPTVEDSGLFVKQKL